MKIEDRFAMSFHEAGHVLVTHKSFYFGLKDPAVRIHLTGPFLAVSGFTKIRDTTDAEHHKPSTRDFVRIALAGRAVEVEILERQKHELVRLIPNPDGAESDLKSAMSTLVEMGMEDEFQGLWGETVEIVRKNWGSIEALANLILQSSLPEISRESVLLVLCGRD